MYRILKEDADFRMLNLPLSEQAHTALESKIASGICPVVLISWKGYLADGYECYDLCQKYHVQPRSEDWYFSRKENAISWLCRKQLKRTDLCTNAVAWFLYKLYDNELKLIRIRKAKDSFQYRQLSPSQFSSDFSPEEKGSQKLRSRIAKEFEMCGATIYRYISFGRRLDQLEMLFPGTRLRVLTGDLDIARAHIEKILSMPHEQLFHILADPSCKQLLPPQEKKKDQPSSEKRVSPTVKLDLQIKQMPAYDPDSELNGLVYTIGSWIRAVTRITDSVSLQEESGRGKSQLKASLSDLIKTADELKQRLEALPNE